MGSKIDIPPNDRHWWKEGVVYQVYPASFKDSNGDGIGDIPGIISEIDYIHNLGVDIVWLNPIFKSPQDDMGYDIADYESIHAPYGTMQDVDKLKTELHKRGMKLVLDMVFNHTSSEHEWFKKSRASLINKFRDWYIWKQPKYDSNGERQPPNNWKSAFGGSAWEYDETTNEYYLHIFARSQPDLNWENPEVQEAVYSVMRFWLSKGIDGFRLDVINFISKVPGYPDAPVTDPDSKWQDGSMYYVMGPRLHEWLGKMGQILKEYDAFSVGEMPYVKDLGEVLKVVGRDRFELNMVFHFEIVDLDIGSSTDKFVPRQWTLKEMKSIFTKWQHYMYENAGWNALYMENHDQSRTVSRFAVDDTPEHRVLSAKMLATMLGFQSGTLFVYQGQELGQVNVDKNVWTMEDYRDIETLNHWKEMLEVHGDDAAMLARTQAQYYLKSRDNARTPMQWTDGPYAGFSTTKPWIRLHDDYDKWNAALQTTDPQSVYAYWKRVLELRKHLKDIIVYGRFELIDGDNEDVFAYMRADAESKSTLLIVMNFRVQPVEWTLPANIAFAPTKLLLSNYEKIPKIDMERWNLRPLEAIVCRITIN